MHYYRVLRTGIVETTPRAIRAKNWQDRFWSKVAQDGECWRWTSASDAYGYGVFRVQRPRRMNIKAHRASYELMVADIPEGLVIDHLCRNRWCVNPYHMDPVTPEVNGLRAVTA